MITEDQLENQYELSFILPFGIEAPIFPWGVQSIKEYIDKNNERISTAVINFQKDSYFTKVVVKHGALFSKILSLLKPSQVSIFFNLAINPYKFFGALACCGRNFLKLMGCHKRLTNAEYDVLDQIKTQTEKHIMQKLDRSNDLPKTAHIWAISVFDGTLFNSLFIARLIRKFDPTSPIILGGDYFDFETAEKLMRGPSLVDAVIVGYGEEVLSKLCIATLQGLPIRNQEISGLVNDHYIANQNRHNLYREITPPPFYHELISKPAISYVKMSEAGVLHVITQRGCSWGRCTFCTQIDKCNLYTISTNVLLQEIFELVQLSDLRTVKISFDSEEVSYEFLVAFTKYCKQYPDISFQIDLWFQVKKFRKELIDQLMELDLSKINITFHLNFESLNYDTLIHMKKGHSPLKAIEAAKSITDCGLAYDTNYFIEFPLENTGSITEEAGILESVIHLLKHQRGDLLLFPYFANKRDEIYCNPKKYKVAVRHNPRDRLLKDVFHVDLPYSFWSYEYRYRFNCSLDFLLTAIYHRINSCRSALDMHPVIIKQFFIADESAYYKSMNYKLRRTELSLLTAASRVFAIFKKGKAYQKRFDIFTCLQTNPNTYSNNQLCSFQLKGDYLSKNYSILGFEERWTMHLDHVDVRILRYLYWKRKQRDVVEEFKSEKTEQDIEKFIRHHIELGTIIQSKDLLLCVVNDPEYWISRRLDQKTQEQKETIKQQN